MRSFFVLFTLFVAAAIPLQTLGARTADEPTGLAGKWHFVLDTEGGDRNVDADFKVDDGKVTGTFGKAEVKGTATALAFDLEFELDSDEAGKGTMKMTGKIADDLTGKWSFQSYDGTFKASRPKTPPAGAN